MANPEHLERLRAGVDAWNEWRNADQNTSVVPDLTEADLRAANLRAANLSRADLMMANLRAANLKAANLSEANLRAANLSEANLRRAKLRGANLSEANLSGADLSGAEIEQAMIAWTVFADLDLSDAKGLATVGHFGPCTIGIDTLYRSKGAIPEVFLRGCGLPDQFIRYARSLVGRAIEFYSCFISYSHADKAFARALHDTLQGRGIRCWLDEKELVPGDDIYEHIDRGIRLSDKFLLCCSAHSLKPASWVDKEIVTVLEKEDELTRQRGAKVRALIPLNLDGYLFTDHWKSGYHAEIRRRLAADFTGWERDRGKFDREVENVIRALRADATARDPAPEPKL